MALTMVQQCKAWFEAGLDDNIIKMVYDLARDQKFSLDSQAAINLPQSAKRQEQIDALFWLGAAQNRQGVKHNDLTLIKSGIELLLPLYSEYCDDLNYFVSLALAFEYLGQYEHALYYLYEAMGQFPKVAHVDDMIESVAAKLNIDECDFSFNSKVRAAWQELLNNVPRIKSYLAIVNPSVGEQQALKDLVTKPFSNICSFFDVQIQTKVQDVYFYLSCHGDESLFIALNHCLTLKRDGFPKNWHFLVGLVGLGKVNLEVDELNFDSEQTWCRLELAPEHHELKDSRLANSALALLNSKFDHQNHSGKIEPTVLKLQPQQAVTNSDWAAIEKTNLTNNLGHKKVAIAPENNNSSHSEHAEQSLVTNFNETPEPKSNDKEPSLDLSQLDHTLFADLFDDDPQGQFNPEDGTYEPSLSSNCFKSLNKNYVLKLYHPLLFTWFKASKSQHPLVLDRMMKTLSSYALGELNVIGLFDKIEMVKHKEPLSYKLSQLSSVLEAMDINTIDSYSNYLGSSYILDNAKGKDSNSFPLLDKLALPLRENLLFSVHNNAQLYHELYHEPCDHSAINLLCAQCVPFYFAIKRSDMICSTTSDAATATTNGLGASAGATAGAGASTNVGAGVSAGAGAGASAQARATAGAEAYAGESPLATMEKKSQRDGTILSANENTISDDDMQRVTELFIEDFTNYIISHGYQYSLHFMGYALNKDYVFIDVLAFDFKLCLYALSSYLTENYPDVISLQASLLIKGSTSATIDFIKEL